MRFMIKKLILCLLLSSSLFANVSITRVQYEGGISIFGKVADASVIFKKDLTKHTYIMKVTAASIGIVKALTSNRKDIFTSEGDIKNGTYIPNKFTKLLTKTDYVEKTVYIFEYTKKRVLKKTSIEELVDNSSFDIIKLQRINKKKLIKINKKKYITLYPNDYLSMYLNLVAGKLKDGDIKYIDQKNTDDVLLISRSVFEVSKHNGDEKYRINILKNKSMFFDKAVAEDIAFYGDAYIKKISEEKSIDLSSMVDSQ